MKIRNSTIFNTWLESLSYFMNSTDVVPTERNLDTYEMRNVVLEVENPLGDIDSLLSFERSRGIEYTSEFYEEYWKIVRDKVKKFPKSSVNQEDVIIDKLKECSYNRHGYASIWVPTIDTVVSRPSCITGIYFMVRNEKLNMTAILRSNDAWGQALNDMYELVRIQKHVANRLQMEIGEYTHFAMSYHLYIKDYIDAKMLLEEKNIIAK